STIIYRFYQPDDGIRGFHVTGVQTCALPIFETVHAGVAEPSIVQWKTPWNTSSASTRRRRGSERKIASTVASVLAIEGRDIGARSEERRVGKEGKPGSTQLSYVGMKTACHQA